MITFVMLAWPPPAFAWECLPSDAGCTCDQVDGSSMTWHRESSSFTAAEIAEIEAAANAWDAGPGLPMRGASFDFVRGNDQTNVATGNFANEVYERDSLWFDLRGFDPAELGRAITVDATPCTNGDSVRIEVDIVFNSDKSWSTSLASQTPNSNPSIGQVAVHEFGHALGFDHEDHWLGTMNSKYPNGGDISAVPYRINENDYVGLAASKPDGSTGKTLMLTKFDRTGPGTSQEVWTEANNSEVPHIWGGCPGTVITGADRPSAIGALLAGTTGVGNVVVEWTLSANATCFDDDDVSLGTKTISLAADNPMVVNLDSWTIPLMTAGQYSVCAKIDPDDAISETTENDNNLKSEKLFTVLKMCP